MRYEVSRLNEKILLKLEGDIDIAVAPQLREVLEKIIGEGVKKIVIDITNVPFIDSTGLGLFVNAYKKVNQRGGWVAFVGASRAIRKIFQLTKLEVLFKFCDTIEEASSL